MEVTVQELNDLINDDRIEVLELRKHLKASEKYVDVKFTQNDGFIWETSIPYYYRRTGTFMETPEELATYLKEIFPLFTEVKIAEFKREEQARWTGKGELSGKKTTKGFFEALIDLEWNSVVYDFPENKNWARRTQDLKEFGYTVATNTNRKVKGKNENDTHLILIPLPKGGVTGYEVMSDKFKKKAFEALDSINVYENSKSNKHGLIPDHKFSEIRWDETTRGENPEDMDGAEIKSKFQLLDNQRNQQKREVCRKCFQTGKRATIFGVDFFYEGDENWPEDIPKVGKEAERGCIGCGWYDIETWRQKLNEKAK